MALIKWYCHLLIELNFVKFMSSSKTIYTVDYILPSDAVLGIFWKKLKFFLTLDTSWNQNFEISQQIDLTFTIIKI